MDETIRVTRFISAQLLRDTKILAALSQHAVSDNQEVALSEAVLLMGFAAIEATLHEAAYLTKRELYSREYCHLSPLKKLRRLRDIHSDVLSHLSQLRNALTHNEPQNERGRDLSKHLNAQAAQKLASQAIDICLQAWGDAMPNWYSEVVFPDSCDS